MSNVRKAIRSTSPLFLAELHGGLENQDPTHETYLQYQEWQGHQTSTL